jgi:hypothetical protein
MWPRSFTVTFVAALALSLACATSVQAAEPEHAPMLVDIDFTLVNIGASVAGHLGRGWYAGGGASILPPPSINGFRAYPFEMADVRVFTRFVPNQVVQIDFGARASVFTELKICVLGCPAPQSGGIVGVYTAIAFGTRHFKIGPRLELGERTDRQERALLFYPIMMRIEDTPN